MDAVDVSEDLGYTVFGFEFAPVAPGTSQSVTLRYELPFSLNFQPADNYRFIAQKQAGAGEMHLRKTLATSDYLKVLKSYPPSTEAFTLNQVYDTEFDKNEIFVSALASLN